MFCKNCGTELTEMPAAPLAPVVTRPSRIRVPPIRQVLPRIVGGAVILVSVFLPYGQGSPSLWDLMTPILSSIRSLGEMVPVSFFVMAVAFFLLLIGGVVALFRHLVGGILAVIGVCFLSVPLHDALGGFDWLGVMGFGYYATWAGAIACFVYSFFMWRRRRAESLPKALELPPPPPDTNYAPTGDATHPRSPGLSPHLRKQRCQRP